MPSDAPIALHTTPMVAAVPKEVPVRKESRLFIRNTISKNTDGWMISAKKQTITGIVPAHRHSAVIMPISTKVISMFRAVFTPASAKRKTSRSEYPFRIPHRKKSAGPPAWQTKWRHYTQCR